MWLWKFFKFSRGKPLDSEKSVEIAKDAEPVEENEDADLPDLEPAEEELAVHTLVRESSLRDDGEPPPGRDAGLETEPQSSPPASPPESPLLGPASPEMSPSPEILTLPLPKVIDEEESMNDVPVCGGGTLEDLLSPCAGSLTPWWRRHGVSPVQKGQVCAAVQTEGRPTNTNKKKKRSLATAMKVAQEDATFDYRDLLVAAHNRRVNAERANDLLSGVQEAVPGERDSKSSQGRTGSKASQMVPSEREESRSSHGRLSQSSQATQAAEVAKAVQDIEKTEKTERTERTERTESEASFDPKPRTRKAVSLPVPDSHFRLLEENRRKAKTAKSAQAVPADEKETDQMFTNPQTYFEKRAAKGDAHCQLVALSFTRT
ncbi:unnamed protein product [Effrenium voratum]|nr:unnamed protein product [Effrenium voratum]